MGKRIFISYSHHQAKWVGGRLVPVLRAGGADLLIDEERMKGREPLIGQMDALQDQAEFTLSVVTGEYRSSDYCLHEYRRATDPFEVVRNGDALDDSRVFAALADDRQVASWDLVMRTCEASLGADAPEWLRVADELSNYLSQGKSVNLVVRGHPRWKELLKHIGSLRQPRLAIVDASAGECSTRQGLISAIFRARELTTETPRSPEDLVEFSLRLQNARRTELALVRCDFLKGNRASDVRFWSAVRALIEGRHLVLIAESRDSVANLLPKDHPMSHVGMLEVELSGR